MQAESEQNICVECCCVSVDLLKRRLIICNLPATNKFLQIRPYEDSCKAACFRYASCHEIAQKTT